MKSTTIMRKELILKLFKDFTVDYNPNTISKEIKKTRVGAYKALIALENQGIVKGKTLGKARFYSIDLEDEYARKSVETHLIEESKQFNRWKEEFKELFLNTEVIVLFGSILKNEKDAKDVDLLLILKEQNNKNVNEFIRKKNEILLKKIHPLKQTRSDFENNIREKDKIILSAIKTGIVLHGYDEYVDMIRNVKSRK
jgi:hypothetical protein